MTVLSATSKALSNLLLNTRWNRTTQEASIARVLLALEKKTFFEEIENESESVYNKEFKKAYEKWQELETTISDYVVLENCLNLLFINDYVNLVNNFSYLRQHQLPEMIVHWNYGTKGNNHNKMHIIKEIHKIGTHVIIERADNNFQHNGCAFSTIDEAIIRAIAVKYDGENTKANKYICAMLNIA